MLSGVDATERRIRALEFYLKDFKSNVAWTHLGALNDLAAEKAMSLAGEGELIPMVGVLEGRAVPEGVEWRVEYTVLPPSQPEPPAPAHWN
jgi:hypothetical protein